MSKLEIFVLGLRISNFEILGFKISNFTNFTKIKFSQNRQILSKKFLISQIILSEIGSNHQHFVEKKFN